MAKWSDPAERFLLKALGQEGVDELKKFELVKEKTQTVLDHEEIKTALQIVPRTVLSLLYRELAPMEDYSNKEVKLPVDPEATLSVTKLTKDVYSGSIAQKGKIISKFQYRSLPGVGLIIMTAFELYEEKNIAELASQPHSSPSLEQIQSIIDERLRLQSMISDLVDKKISQRDVMEKMVSAKLSQMLEEHGDVEKEEPKTPVQKPEKKIKTFLDKIKSKKQKEIVIKMEKNETISCPDCGKKIFDQGAFSGCICYGEDRNKAVHLKKNENGVSIRFSKGWDEENISMLLDILKRKNRG